MALIATAPPTLTALVHSPCATCNAHELHVLQNKQDPQAAKWIYTMKVPTCCTRCSKEESLLLRRKHDVLKLMALAWIAALRLVRRKFGRYFSICSSVAWAYIAFRVWRLKSIKEREVQIPLLMDDVAVIERVMGAASVSEKGSNLRPYGSFIAYLTTYTRSGGGSEVKTALQVWAPLAIGSFLRMIPGVGRRATAGGTSAESDPAEVQNAIVGNPDVEGGELPGTSVPRDAYKEDAVVQPHEKCMNDATVEPPEPKTQAHRIGPDLRQVETFASTSDNIAAAIDNRFQAPPYNASPQLEERITKVVEAAIKVVFPAEKIRRWRTERMDYENNLVTGLEDMKSKKWTQQRAADAIDEAFADVAAGIEQTFQNKTNEVQDAAKKLPRPRNIIQCGDTAQIKMLLPVKCFENLLFDHFGEASIKKGTKYEAMGKVAKRLHQQRPVSTIEGDGSSWDACCNHKIRELTENRVLRHIIDVLGYDAEVPQSWLQQVIEDMEAKKIRGKAKTIDYLLGKTKVKVSAIRQSGHRGTSAFNYFINLVCWLAILADNPEDLIEVKDTGKWRQKHLPEKYRSSFDHTEHTLRYAFEGDDSALTTSEDVKSEARKQHILELWESLGFKMKLVFADKKLNFTGFDFLVGPHGPRSVFTPEVKRAFASCSWTTSSEVRSDPSRLSRVGAAAFLARAEQFVDCQPISHYFAAMARAHAARCGGGYIDESEAMQYGIAPGGLIERIEEAAANARPISKPQRELLEVAVGNVSEEKLIGLINIHVDDPLDTAFHKNVLPKEFWYEARSPSTRPRGPIETLLHRAA